jgi:DNA polymerase-3 subunit epsilon
VALYKTHSGFAFLAIDNSRKLLDVVGVLEVPGALMRAICLDVETTGLYAAQGDRVCELACVEIKDKIPTGRTWHWYFNPGRDINPEAQRIHGLTAAFLEDKPPFSDVYDAVLDVLGDDTLIAHNAPFDVGFLNAEFHLAGLGPKLITMDRVIDTLAMARQKYPGKKNSLDALCQRFKIDNSARRKHSAMLDTKLLTRVYYKLDSAEQTCLDLQNSPVLSKPVTQRSSPLLPRITSEEIEAHTEMLSGLNCEPIWNRYSQ